MPAEQHDPEGRCVRCAARERRRAELVDEIAVGAGRILLEAGRRWLERRGEWPPPGREDTPDGR